MAKAIKNWFIFLVVCAVLYMLGWRVVGYLFAGLVVFMVFGAIWGSWLMRKRRGGGGRPPAGVGARVRVPAGPRRGAAVLNRSRLEDE